MLPWQNGYIFPIASQQVEIESSHTAIALGSLACSCARLPYADQTTELCSKDSMRTVTNKQKCNTHKKPKKRFTKEKKKITKG